MPRPKAGIRRMRTARIRPTGRHQSCPARPMRVSSHNMSLAISTNRFAANLEVLCGLIARYGHLRRLAGPLVVLIWNRVRRVGAQFAAIQARMQAGQLRRHPARRSPRPAAAPRRPAAPSMLPRDPAWLMALIPETAVSAAHLRLLLTEPEVPALLEAAPQLRRALRPLCRMLGVALPPRPPVPQNAALARDTPPDPPPISPFGPDTKPRPPSAPRAARPAAPSPPSACSPAGRRSSSAPLRPAPA
jgi:hypothetical protein